MGAAMAKWGIEGAREGGGGSAAGGRAKGVERIKYKVDSDVYRYIRENFLGISRIEAMTTYRLTEKEARMCFRRLRDFGLIATTHTSSVAARWVLPERVAEAKVKLDAEFKRRSAARIRYYIEVRAAVREAERMADEEDDDDKDYSPFVHRLIPANEATPIRPAKPAWIFAQ